MKGLALEKLTRLAYCQMYPNERDNGTSLYNLIWVGATIMLCKLLMPNENYFDNRQRQGRKKHILVSEKVWEKDFLANIYKYIILELYFFQKHPIRKQVLYIWFSGKKSLLKLINDKYWLYCKV